MKKIYIPALALFLLISGCNDSTPTTSTSGNFATKAEQLPAQNETAIRADLNLINPILNKANSKAIATRNELAQAIKNDNKEEVKSIFSKSKQSLETTNSALLSLNMQSQEVQKIRTNVINGNMIAIQLHDLALKEEKTAEDKKEMMLLSKRLVALQKTTGTELDNLNTKYK